jgi:hypothetical protein
MRAVSRVSSYRGLSEIQRVYPPIVPEEAGIGAHEIFLKWILGAKKTKLIPMDKAEIERKAEELSDILVKYKKDLGALEGGLFGAINAYHEALKAEKLKEMREKIKSS